VGDLHRLDDVRSLLTALNDAYVSSREIQDLVAKVPVLAARCIRRAGSEDFESREALHHSPSKIGNMGVESELLGLLEDLTTFQADLQEEETSAEEDPHEE